jgi:hypothetical protein
VTSADLKNSCGICPRRHRVIFLTYLIRHFLINSDCSDLPPNKPVGRLRNLHWNLSARFVFWIAFIMMLHVHNSTRKLDSQVCFQQFVVRTFEEHARLWKSLWDTDIL